MRRLAHPLLVLLAALVAACGASSVAQPTTGVASNAPTALAPTAAGEPDMIATIAAMGPTAAPVVAAALPTQAATITAAPTAEPQPLATGWWDGAVCYEVFVRSFADSNGDGIGDFQGLTQRLDYISDGDPTTTSDLGANCVWLMPIAESTSYHGYDVEDYYNVERDYGSNEDFKAFVAAAHQRGIKVILDLVLNHTSSEHPWFKEALSGTDAEYRDWYLWSQDDPGYRGPWGDRAWHPSPLRDEYFYGIFYEGMPDLNYRNPEVTAEAHKISSFWVNEMGVDGFRLDAIKHVIENGTFQENTLETHAWLREYRAFLQQNAPVFTVGEIFGASPGVLAPYYPDQLDSYFTFNVGERILSAANGGTGGSFLDAVESTNAQLPFQRWAPFLTNHDQDRALSRLGGDLGKARIAATALLTLPGMPFIYYGEEIGMAGVKPDERLRTPMQWSADASGFSAGKPWQGLGENSSSNNVAAQSDDPASLLNLYRKLVHLHTTRPALAQGSFTPLVSSNPSVVAFLRQQGDERVLVVLNFANQPITDATLSLAESNLPAGVYQAQPLLGEEPGTPLNIMSGGAVSNYAPLVSFAPRTGYIFTLEP